MKQKQIYFWLFLFITGMLHAQSVHYRYDRTGNRTARSTTASAPASAPASVLTNDSLQSVYEQVIPDAIELLPPGIHPSVHTSGVLPDDPLSAVQQASVPIPVPIPTSINTNYAVGEIPITTSVDNGSLSYQVPIEVHPGRQNFQPEIALCYNSMAGNGVAGAGWSISGISSITPVHGNFYYDGLNAQPEKLARNADYALDGMSLRRIGAGIYQSEQGHISAVHWENSNKYYFSVTFPDGRTATYGNSNHTTHQINYPLTYMADEAGNSIRYNYIISNNTWYISEIAYGYSNLPTGKITFHYNNREDVTEGYRMGKQIKQDKLLSRIEVYHENHLLHTYTLNYVYKDINLLKTIRFTAGASELNPLTFHYNAEHNQAGGFQTSDALLMSYFPTSEQKIVYQRFKENNSIATEGLISYPDFATYGTLGCSSVACKYGSPYPPNQNILVYKNLTSGPCTPQRIVAGENFAGVLAIDHNGNGKENIFILRYKYNSNNSLLTITDHGNGSDTPISRDVVLEGYVNENNLMSPAPRIFLSGDFTGEGKTKLLTVSGNKTLKDKTNVGLRSYVTIINPGIGASIEFDKRVFDYDMNKDVLLTMDFNGDGRTDICHIHTDGTDIYSYIGGELVKIAGTTTLALRDISSLGKQLLYVADVNGDGKTDLILSPAPKMYTMEKKHMGSCQGGCKGRLISISADGDIETWESGGKYCYVYTGEEEKVYKPGAFTWKFFISKGDAFERRPKELFLSCERDYEYLFYDVNGDRLPDLIVKSENEMKVHLNINGDFKAVPEAGRSISNNVKLLPGVVTSSTSAENRLSQLLVINNATVSAFNFNRNDAQRRKISTMVNSLGVEHRTVYESMSNPAVLRINGSILSGSHYSAIINESLVHKTETWLKSQLLAAQTYTYQDIAFHREGIGFCGFRQIKITDRIRQTNTNFNYNLLKQAVLSWVDSPEKTLYLYYKHVVDSKKRRTLTVTRTQENDKLTSFVTHTSFLYDQYDNVEQQIIQYPGGVSVTTDNSYDYIYHKRKLCKQTVTTVRNNQRWVEEMYVPSFDWDSRQPEFVIRSVNGNKVSETHNLYSGSELTTTVEKRYDSHILQIREYSYDRYGRVTFETDPMGLVTRHAYDPKTGKLQTTTNHRSKEIKYHYNALGRLTKTVYPDGVVDSTAYDWTTTPAGAVYKITRTVTGKPTSVVWLNAIHQELRSGSQRFNEDYLYTDYQYDNRGRLVKESLPFKVSPQSNGITYSYDAFDRITQVSHPAGTTTRYAYNNATVTTTSGGIATTRTIDGTGNVVSVTDPGGTILYDYRADGQLSAVTAPGNIRIEFGYDQYGRQTRISDPGYGEIQYTYDPVGNLQKTIDAENNQTTYTYDRMDRVLTKTSGDMITTYEYQNELLKKISNNQGTSTVYTYDDLHRITHLRENAPDGKWLEKEVSYANGTIRDIKYTSQSGVIATVGNQYAYGHITEQKLNNQTSFFRLNSENIFGAPTGVTTGGITRSYSYTANGVMSGRSAATNTHTFQNFTYGMDAAKGNMNWRKDNVRNRQEDFTYDNLNRLTNFAGNTVTYDAKGNISAKSNAGTYRYTNSGKPYSVTEVNNATGSIPVRNQSIEYYSFRRPKSITENGYTATFHYNAKLERVKMHLTKNGTRELTRYYLGGCYEIDEERVGNTKEKLYLGGDYYSAPAVYVKENNGSWQLYYICRDHLGSITHLTNSSGVVVTQELSYDAWGTLRNPVNQTNYTPGNEPALFLGRGYTGHEHLPWFGLVNMNARLYDPALGRFLAPDPYVQSPEFTQNFNRYSYCLNNPLLYVDENGEFLFFSAALVGGLVAVLKGVATGAVIGAAISAGVYSVSAAITNNWSWQSFGMAVGMGAAGGAISGGLGAAGGAFGAFGNSMGYSMLSSSVSNIATNAAFGNEITLGSIAGGVAGGLTGALLPSFKAIPGSGFKNAVAETGFNTIRGGLKGLASGSVQALIADKRKYIVQGLVGGMITGGASTIMNNVLFGTPYVPKEGARLQHNSVIKQPLFRQGGLIMFGAGITLGRNLTVTDGSDTFNTEAHEYYHWVQQQESGWSRFYSRVMSEYLRYGMSKSYSTVGTLEYSAEKWAQGITNERDRNNF